MKKSILMIAALVLSFGSLHAQFNLGLKAGVNLASLNTDFASKENRLGYQLGAWARIGSGFYVQPEAYFGSKGNRFVSFTNNNGTEVEAEGKVRFTTLDIPVLLGTRVGVDKLNLRFMAGPVVSFVLDENATFSSAYDQATDFRNYKNNAFAAQFGAGVDVGNLAVDLRYEAGLSNISNSDRYKQRPNVWQLSLGWKLF
ncbi:PorT family protein [Pedobacter yulinensis]|uniref:PorT family protein n=1 Tax=Pedobacter yulinensis TaxID=2126353 RepID=A0A2T3HQ36_9SPHI|nr:porin family protein [Pedobacter yulinensis]PST84501.1 PorT family protein [Pedobacter yulinensis]